MSSCDSNNGNGFCSSGTDSVKVEITLFIAVIKEIMNGENIKIFFDPKKNIFEQKVRSVCTSAINTEYQHCLECFISYVKCGGCKKLYYIVELSEEKQKEFLQEKYEECIAIFRDKFIAMVIVSIISVSLNWRERITEWINKIIEEKKVSIDNNLSFNELKKLYNDKLEECKQYKTKYEEILTKYNRLYTENNVLTQRYESMRNQINNMKVAGGAVEKEDVKKISESVQNIMFKEVDKLTTKNTLVQDVNVNVPQSMTVSKKNIIVNNVSSESEITLLSAYNKLANNYVSSVAAKKARKEFFKQFMFYQCSNSAEIVEGITTAPKFKKTDSQVYTDFLASKTKDGINYVFYPMISGSYESSWYMTSKALFDIINYDNMNIASNLHLEEPAIISPSWQIIHKGKIMLMK